MRGPKFSPDASVTGILEGHEKHHVQFYMESKS